MSRFNQIFKYIYKKHKKEDPNLTIEKFSDEIGLPIHLVKAYLRDSMPCYENKQRVADAIGIPYEELYGHIKSEAVKKIRKRVQLYENINRILDEKHMNLIQLTKMCGISYSSYVSMVGRRIIPSYTYARNIANKLEVPIEELMGDDYSIDDDIKETLSRLSIGNKKFICNMVENMVSKNKTT